MPSLTHSPELETPRSKSFLDTSTRLPPTFQSHHIPRQARYLPLTPLFFQDSHLGQEHHYPSHHTDQKNPGIKLNPAAGDPHILEIQFPNCTKCTPLTPLPPPWFSPIIPLWGYPRAPASSLGPCSSAALIELAEGPFQNSVTDASVAEAVL